MRPKTLVKDPANFMHPAELSFHPSSGSIDPPGKASVVSKQSVLTTDTTDTESCVFDEAAKGYFKSSRVFRSVMSYLSPSKLVLTQMPTKSIMKGNRKEKKLAIKQQMLLKQHQISERKKYYEEYMDVPLSRISRKVALDKAEKYCSARSLMLIRASRR